ncbi:MAG: glycosyltransferase family 4 protein [Rhodospirillaceae bacterium]|jgi:glycosyltransferase involved in cell wall biosynthesis|nr:glycosyltransferase family 4 protein [Rhodospirillaceae bacterium]MBT3931158.1 glycosyltransferase family 4 protein [Rhodospirillaceae bacterium]MBT4772775.1 glycosyltransferase family 4 protein [Rhodospirillaceae bacterium]MBT5359292.1 glycosyltransferase family 4 protein [Rhodospirillaceae bacterium]MBT5770993.1 glycosyltransferase family 4 protein [Rhodospirillaceae bacterium]
MSADSVSDTVADPVADAAAAGRTPLRLAVVAQFPVHYHLPLYRAMAADPDIDVNVLFMQRGWSASGFDPEVGTVVEWGVEKFTGYPHRIFPNISPTRSGSGFWKFINPGLIWHVLTGPHDAVYIHGHNHFSHVACAIAAKLGGKRLIIRTISNNLGARPRWVRALRQMLYRPLYMLANVLLYIGQDNRDYFRNFGVPDRKLVHAPHVVDDAFFAAEAARMAGREAELKAAFGIAGDQKIVLYSAKFMPKKQPLMLVAAFAEAGLGDDWTLLMVGEGEQRAAAEVLAGRHPDAQIIFAGWLDQSRIAEGYAIADMLVLPSAYQETWGLIINEAMNFGCPVIVSDRVSCGCDLVADTCGLIFPYDDRPALVAALRKLAGDDAMRAGFRAGAKARIAGWNVSGYIAGLRRALRLSD